MAGAGAYPRRSQRQVLAALSARALQVRRGSALSGKCAYFGANRYNRSIEVVIERATRAKSQ